MCTLAFPIHNRQQYLYNLYLIIYDSKNSGFTDWKLEFTEYTPCQCKLEFHVTQCSVLIQGILRQSLMIIQMSKCHPCH